MKFLQEDYEVVVCGGGLAGFCAAVASARKGAKTCLIHDRPVFGGNSSSEIRVTTHGSAAFHAYSRETGIVSELLIEERANNHEDINENGWTNSVWDMTMYDMAMNTPNLTFHVNTTVQDVNMLDEKTIQSVVCRVANAETEITISGKTFIDCTGDGVIADLAGCEWRLGTEARSEFNEPHATEEETKDVMGSSIHFKAVNMGRPVPYKAPDWIFKYEDASFFYKQGRPLFNTGHSERYRGGYWWIEIGVPWDTIYQAEDIRHELTRHTLGVWDYIKNRDPEMKKVLENYALDWIGQVPGKRESRRIMGQYLMTEHDPLNKTSFPDEVAYGGWNVDLHTAGGLLAPSSEPAAMEGYKTVSDFQRKTLCGPYSIPLRMLIAKDVNNLMMAGRNVSATHAALGTVRVIGTTAIMGQAVGTAAAIGLKQGIAVHDLYKDAITDIQQALLRDGCFLLEHKNEDPLDIARAASVTASSSAKIVGVGPDTVGYHQGLSTWKSQKQASLTDALEYRRGQWIAVNSDRIHSLSVCLTNRTSEIQEVPVKLLEVDHIWEYQIEGLKELAAGTLQVPPGEKLWIQWDVNITTSNGLTPGKFVRLDLLANEHVEWLRAGRIEPGQVCAFDIGGNKMRRYDNGITMSFQIDPPQPSYEPENVINGFNRPYQYTNMWRSDAASKGEQWLQLEWDNSRKIAQVELTFAGNLLREYHAYEPFYRDQQCVKDYTVSAWVDEKWQELFTVTDNYQPHRVHAIAQPISSSKLRITIHSTHGDPSAAIYEVRCYE